MHPFSTLQFSDVIKGVEKGWIRNKWVKVEFVGEFAFEFLFITPINTNSFPCFWSLLWALIPIGAIQIVRHSQNGIFCPLFLHVTPCLFLSTWPPFLPPLSFT